MERTTHSASYTVAGTVTSISVRLEMCGQCQRKKKQKKKNRMFRSSTNKELEHVAKIQVALNELCGKSEFF